MTVSNSSHKAAKRKPAKPHKDVLRFAHASGKWAKEVRSKFIYIGG